MQKIKQNFPIDFGAFVFGDIKNLFDDTKIFINYDYQRGDVWTNAQQVDLIRSIFNSYSIGVLVLYINDSKQFEILDGQQRLLTVKKYLNNCIDLKNTNIKPYNDLDSKEKAIINAYHMHYLELKAHTTETKEEDIIQTFLRLQEGSPLNKAEKINAHRGVFKDTFREIRSEHPIFKRLGNDKRFRLRLLCAELLHLELESDFDVLKFPSLNIHSLKESCKKYEKEISKRKLTSFKGNLNYLEHSLNFLLTGMPFRDLIPFYLLISYLRRKKADNSDLKNELSAFCADFLKKIHSFSTYDDTPPKNMSKEEFIDHLNYKNQGRKATSADSIKFRFDFLKKQFETQIPFIRKDPKRLHDIEQKRTLFFRQKGVCPECEKDIDFTKRTSAHHVIAHKDGGKTDDLQNAVLLHEKCHANLEKKLKKQ